MHLRHDEIRQKYGETHFFFFLIYKWKFVISKMLVFTKLLFTCTVINQLDKKSELKKKLDTIK